MVDQVSIETLGLAMFQCLNRAIFIAIWILLYTTTKPTSVRKELVFISLECQSQVKVIASEVVLVKKENFWKCLVLNQAYKLEMVNTSKRWFSMIILSLSMPFQCDSIPYNSGSTLLYPKNNENPSLGKRLTVTKWFLFLVAGKCVLWLLYQCCREPPTNAVSTCISDLMESVDSIGRDSMDKKKLLNLKNDTL